MNPRELFDEMTDLCQRFTGRPWDGTEAHLWAAILRQREVTEVLDAHLEWLSDIRTRVLESGTDWTPSTCSAQARRDGDLAASPEWIARLSAELTPDDRLNR